MSIQSRSVDDAPFSASGNQFLNVSKHIHWLHILAGPAIFLIVLTLPIFGSFNARFGFGILFWMIYWWVTPSVDIKVTCLVPVLVAAVYPYMPVDKVLQAYMDKDFLLIVGMCMVTAGWARWGFAKRVGLRFLSLIGNS